MAQMRSSTTRVAAATFGDYSSPDVTLTGLENLTVAIVGASGGGTVTIHGAVCALGVENNAATTGVLIVEEVVGKTVVNTVGVIALSPATIAVDLDSSRFSRITGTELRLTWGGVAAGSDYGLHAYILA